MADKKLPILVLKCKDCGKPFIAHALAYPMTEDIANLVAEAVRNGYTENIGKESDGMAVPHDGIDNFKQHWLFIKYRLVATLIYDLFDHLDFIFMEIFMSIMLCFHMITWSAMS